jgi:hypothetical protein
MGDGSGPDGVERRRMGHRRYPELYRSTPLPRN